MLLNQQYNCWMRVAGTRKGEKSLKHPELFSYVRLCTEMGIFRYWIQGRWLAFFWRAVYFFISLFGVMHNFRHHSYASIFYKEDQIAYSAKKCGVFPFLQRCGWFLCTLLIMIFCARIAFQCLFSNFKILYKTRWMRLLNQLLQNLFNC